MTIEASYVVYCDYCGAWGAESSESVEDAREWAEQQGWHCEDEHDLCTECWEKRARLP